MFKFSFCSFWRTVTKGSSPKEVKGSTEALKLISSVLPVILSAFKFVQNMGREKTKATILVLSALFTSAGKFLQE